jgi:predicted outer membrane repeat protein
MPLSHFTSADPEEKMIHYQVFFYLIAVVTVTQQRVIYVLPDGPESQCPVSDCSSLTAVMSDKLLFNNVSDTTITLLPGVHVLCNNSDKSLFIFENASNFAFRSANSNSSATVTIKCNGTIGFLFQQITDLLISGITFENCGTFSNMQTNDLYTQYPFTLSVMNSSTITITNVSVKNSKGYGLLAVSVCDFHLSESNLVQNEINLYVFIKGIEEMCLGHTNITIFNTKFKADNPGPSFFSRLDQGHVTFSQSSNTLFSTYFQLYESMECHVALSNVEVNEDKRLSCLDVLFHGVTISLCPGKTLLFKKNWYKVTRLPFKIELKPITLHNAFFKNTSISLAQDIDHEFVEVTLSGAYFQNTCVHITIPIINFENTIIFQDNPCGIVLQRKLVIQGSVMMYKNNKGGIQIQNIENVLIRYSQLLIANNYLSNEDAPLVSLHSNLIVEESEIIFENNSGRRSGGVLLLKSNVTFMGMSSTLKFYNNSGSRGGALALYGLSVLILKGTSMKFLGNHASIVGGAIFVEDSDYVHHISVVDKVYSVFYQSDCSLGNSTLYFSNNTALQAGSAIYGGWILETACIFFIYDNLKLLNLQKVIFL